MLGGVIVDFEAPLWEWDARRGDTWIFVSLPEDASEEIRELSAPTRRGFGSLRVRASIGGTTWRTSIFPGSGGPYVLPVKRAVRTAERLDAGDVAAVSLELLDL
ncbi:DUF1905 domain-containing protein [Dactylosporangium darangshiense]|uniref:DUF1905 domain-containing protein n=1 Tax=Dactylosporangium darangshiense TaxID=579108 RepID=A0ABP8D7Q4_9ACTN